MEAERLLTLRQLETYRPYPKQREFHAKGAKYRERLLRAGNQLGKTTAGGAEAAYHLTGLYPSWWEGRRFKKQTIGWASGPSGETTRDNPQRVLLGRPGSIGTGMIPGHLIETKVASRGIADSVDFVTVRHVSGGVSTVKFKFYEQGREKWQGETLDWVWFDEEPPPDIYTEGLTRTNATLGIVWMTLTPLLGMSEVVSWFLSGKSESRADINMTIADAEHIPAAERQRIIDSYPEHEREARVMGIPMLGSGRVFPIAESAIKCEPFQIPRHWVRLGGMDFGWDHPFGAVQIAWDRDKDRVYVTDAYRVREQTPVIHAAALKPWALEWTWPHDGMQHDKGSGAQLAKQYRDQGLRLLPDKATFEDGSVGFEAGVMEMLQRMQTGRLKVFAHLNEWFEEFRIYHRKDGLIVKERDDLLSATRYALMSKRFATTPEPRIQQDIALGAYDPYNPRERPSSMRHGQAQFGYDELA